jgi:pilus assembly protein Flp/PilA
MALALRQYSRLGSVLGPTGLSAGLSAPINSPTINAQQRYSERGMNMIATQIFNFVMRAWRDRRGQDLIEYALMAGFVAVAAGAIMPGVSSSISTIFSQVASVMTNAAS